MGKWTRRGLITAGVMASGALVVGVAIRPGNRTSKLRPLVTEGEEMLVNAWLKITPQNEAIAIVPHAEMGQGTHTALAQMLADELDMDWSLVSVMEAPAHEEYANYALAKGFFMGDADIPKALVGTVDGAFLALTKSMNLQITGGSTSVRATGVAGMRVAGAAAREMLAQAAAREWDVPVAELELSGGIIFHAASDRSATYAEFAAKAAEISPPDKPRLKTAAQYTLMGTSVPRLDVPAKVDGSALFAIDTSLPDLRVAAIKQSPVFVISKDEEIKVTVAAVDGSKALAMKGVEHVVNLGNAVAVVADGYWHAKKGLAAVDVRWKETEFDQVDQAGIFEQFGRDLDRVEDTGDAEEDMVVGDVDDGLEAAVTRVEAEYRVPFLAHAPMEPLNCTARFENGRCEVWTGSQNPLDVRAKVAKVLDIDDEAVTVHNAYLGGGFGRRAMADFSVQAARIAKEINGAVKLIWSREEDIAQDRYRLATTSRFVAGLDENGYPIAWVNRYVNKHEPAEAPHIPYAIANQSIEWVESKLHVPFGPWRSVDHSQHGFFTESFIDELAVKAGVDPYRYRRQLLEAAPRHRAVLDAAAKLGNWGSWSGPGKGQGISLQKSFGTIVAQVVDVRVDGGKVKVERVACAVDAGFAINPDGLKAQMESGIIYGLTAALYGEISITEGRVKQSNFHDYQMVRMDEAPEIETVIINGGGTLGGAGEPGTPGIAPALANAIYQATGKRARQMPLTYGIEAPADEVKDVT